jgi:hypothetical protein
MHGVTLTSFGAPGAKIACSAEVCSVPRSPHHGPCDIDYVVALFRRHEVVVHLSPVNRKVQCTELWPPAKTTIHHSYNLARTAKHHTQQQAPGMPADGFHPAQTSCPDQPAVFMSPQHGNSITVLQHCLTTAFACEDDHTPWVIRVWGCDSI